MMAAHGPEDGAAAGDPVLAAFVLLAAAVVMVPLFKRLGLGSVLGYLAAGVLIGPSVLGFFSSPESILHIAEFGVVLLLFLVGLELNVARLWSMRNDIFGLGTAQVLVTGAALALYPRFAIGNDWPSAIVIGLGVALSSTAMVQQLLVERGEFSRPHGQKAFAILLLQDVAIVPLLALLAFLAPAQTADGPPWWGSALLMIGSLLAVILVGRFLLSRVFALLASLRAREVMLAAALLTVVGAALLMKLSGLSMALGAFLAGVLLAESNYRHQLEADVEPFRDLLLGLFFLAVGMSVDLQIVAENWRRLIPGVVQIVLVKLVVIYALLRITRNDHPISARTAAYLAQGGEFGFVLFTTAAAGGLLSREQSSILTVAVAVSMALTPLVVAFAQRVVCRAGRTEEPEESFDGAEGEVLLVGFGRFGQIVSQVLLAQGVSVTALDSDPQRIEAARRFGFRVYYGDARRMDVLRAAGVERARLAAICVDDPEAADRIVETVREAWPDLPLYVRAWDRIHLLRLRDSRVDYTVRETVHSAFQMGRDALVGLGFGPDEADQVLEEVRRLDKERLQAEQVGGIQAGRGKFRVEPAPLTRRVQRSEQTD